MTCHDDSAIYRNKVGNHDGVWCKGYLLTSNTVLYRVESENEGGIVGTLVFLGCTEIKVI